MRKRDYQVSVKINPTSAPSSEQVAAGKAFWKRVLMDVDTDAGLLEI